MSTAMGAFLLASVLLVGLVNMAPTDDKTYSTKYDNLDVEAILSNPRSLNAYVKCVLDEGPCSPDGREFRRNLPDALKTHCAKCSETQKTIIRKFSKQVIEQHPAEWEKIKKKFDPNGEHHESFVQFMKGS